MASYPLRRIINNEIKSLHNIQTDFSSGNNIVVVPLGSGENPKRHVGGERQGSVNAKLILNAPQQGLQVQGRILIESALFHVVRSHEDIKSWRNPREFNAPRIVRGSLM